MVTANNKDRNSNKKSEQKQHGSLHKTQGKLVTFIFLSPPYMSY